MTDAEYYEFNDAVHASLGGKTIRQVISEEAEVTFEKNGTFAMAERAKMVKQGRRPGDEVRLVAIPANIWIRLLILAKTKNIYMLKVLVAGVLGPARLPIMLVPRKDVIINPPEPPKHIGDDVIVDMDTLIENKAYTVELINKDGSTVEDTAAGTSDANGEASETVTVPTGYAEDEIILRIKQMAATVAEYPADLDADIEHVENHTIAIT